mgnify:CR=1 FL=1
MNKVTPYRRGEVIHLSTSMHQRIKEKAKYIVVVSHAGEQIHVQAKLPLRRLPQAPRRGGPPILNLVYLQATFCQLITEPKLSHL